MPPECSVSGNVLPGVDVDVAALGVCLEGVLVPLDRHVHVCIQLTSQQCMPFWKNFPAKQLGFLA